MSAGFRILSGSLGSIIRLIFIFSAQFLLVPIYITYWGLEVYGLWIFVQAIALLLTIFDVGHLEYLEFEFLKFKGVRKKVLSVNLFSAIVIGLSSGTLMILIILVSINLNLLSYLIEETAQIDKKTIVDVGYVLLLSNAGWLINGNIKGILQRSLVPFGYYPVSVWWNTFIYAGISIITAVLLILGAGLLDLALATFVFIVAVNAAQYIDIIFRLKKLDLLTPVVSFKLGLNNFGISTQLTLKNGLENFRQQGLRLILVPFVGVGGLVTFTTTRTGANVLLQSLNTFFPSLAPEFLRVLHKRDQARCDVMCGIIWIALVFFLCPFVLIFHIVFERLYVIWTRGESSFEPLLFGALLLGTLVFALNQPAILVVRGNTLIKTQIVVSLVATAVVILGIIGLIPLIGIGGAGIAILVSELVANASYNRVAKKWLNENGLRWNRELYRTSFRSIIITAVGIGLFVFVPTSKWFVLIIFLTALGVNAWRFWKVLPASMIQIAKDHVSVFRKRMLPG